MESLQKFIQKKVSFYPQAEGKLENINGEITFVWGSEYEQKKNKFSLDKAIIYAQSQIKDLKALKHPKASRPDERRIGGIEQLDNMITYLKFIK